MTLDKFGYSKLGIKQELLLPSQQLMNSFSQGVPAEMLGDGELVANLKMVDGEMRSSTFEEGKNGWRITADGDVEFDDGIFRGSFTLYKDGEKTIEIKDNTIQLFNDGKIIIGDSKLLFEVVDGKGRMLFADESNNRVSIGY